jgi:hypothetical protein
VTADGAPADGAVAYAGVADETIADEAELDATDADNFLAAGTLLVFAKTEHFHSPAKGCEDDAVASPCSGAFAEDEDNSAATADGAEVVEGHCSPAAVVVLSQRNENSLGLSGQ